MADHGVVCSMSRSGNVWGNAVMEQLLLVVEDRADCDNVPNEDDAKADVFDLSSASTIRNVGKISIIRIFEPDGVRTAGWISLSGCQPNRVQLSIRCQLLALSTISERLICSLHLALTPSQVSKISKATLASPATSALI